MPIGRYLTSKEAASILSVSPATITIWLRQGRIKGVRIGSRCAGWRIHENEIKRLLLIEVKELTDKLVQV